MPSWSVSTAAVQAVRDGNTDENDPRQSRVGSNHTIAASRGTTIQSATIG